MNNVQTKLDSLFLTSTAMSPSYVQIVGTTGPPGPSRMRGEHSVADQLLIRSLLTVATKCFLNILLLFLLILFLLFVLLTIRKNKEAEICKVEFVNALLVTYFSLDSLEDPGTPFLPKKQRHLFGRVAVEGRLRFGRIKESVGYIRGRRRWTMTRL